MDDDLRIRRMQKAFNRLSALADRAGTPKQLKAQMDNMYDTIIWQCGLLDEIESVVNPLPNFSDPADGMPQYIDLRQDAFNQTCKVKSILAEYTRGRHM